MKWYYILFTIILINLYCVSSTDNTEEEVKLIKKLLKITRASNTKIVNTIKQISPQKKQHKIVLETLKKIFEVMRNTKDNIEQNGLVIGETPHLNERLKDAIIVVLENTAFVSELALTFQDIVGKLLQENLKWNELFQWMIEFSLSSKILNDDITSVLLDLASQQFGYREKQLNFVNPYLYREISSTTTTPTQQTKKPKRKTKIPRGPRISISQLGDL